VIRFNRRERSASTAERDQYRAKYAGSDEYKIPPLDAYLQGTGLGHRVISDQQIDKTYVENLAFLYDLLDESVTSEDRQRWVAAKKLVDAKGGLTIKQIEQSIIGLSRISLLTAIAHRELYVDFYMQHHYCPVKKR
jgi:hypothetical protein